MAQEKSNRRIATTAPSKNTEVQKIKYSKEDEPDFYKCPVCGTPYKKLDDNFPASQSELYAGWDYHLPICKRCMDRLFEHYTQVYGGDEDTAIRRICEKFDIYYNISLLNASRKITKNRSRIHTYISRANLVQHKGKTYDTTLDEERKDGIVETYEDIKDEKKTKLKTVKFFGTGFSDDDYQYLQDQYSDWTTRCECKTKAQEEVFKRICFKQLEILKANRAGKDTKDLDKTFQDYLDTANLKPKQNNLDILSDTQTFGTLLAKWENEKPLPEIDEELRDVDKIGLYIDVFFRGHLAKMMGLKNGLSNLYNKFIKKYTVERPEYEGDEDNEALFDAIFGNQTDNE
ncbi:MAG: hypothetical protein K1W19_03180 [Lachnospiraceae bacterium]